MQLGLLLLVVCYRHHQQVHEFVLALTFTLIAAIVIASLAPALGAHIHHGHPFAALHQGIDDLVALRDGSLRRLSLPDIQGIISFPSFHAAMGVLLAWGMRRPCWLFAVCGASERPDAGVDPDGRRTLPDRRRRRHRHRRGLRLGGRRRPRRPTQAAATVAARA